MIRTACVASTMALGLALAGCASGGQRSAAHDFVDETRVEVTNQNWADMRVYAVRSGTRFRLGTVSSMSTQVFRLPRGFTSSSSGLQLIADPIGSREMHMTRSVNIIPGQLVSFRIENHLAISSVSVW